MGPVSNKKHHNATVIALVVALIVVVINTLCGWTLYKLIIHQDAEAQVAGSAEALPSTLPAGTSTAPTTSGSNSATSKSNGSTAILLSPRQTESPIAVGSQPQPAHITVGPDGQIQLQWCSGGNLNLPDGVCAAIISIASNPTTTNPYIGSSMYKWISLLPPNSSVSIDEGSWQKTSGTKGTILVTMHTPTYGDMRLRLTLENVNSLWKVLDGKSA